MIVDLIKFTVRDECLADAISCLKEQSSANRLDDGCVFSHVLQSRSRPSELYMLLGWESRQAVEKHLKTEHDIKFRQDMDSLIACPPEFFDWVLLE